MTTDQVLLGVGLILVLAVGLQALAARLRIPALIILLPAGFIAGALTSDVNPQRLLGAAFQLLVSLAAIVMLPARVHAQYPAGAAEAQACGSSARSCPPASVRNMWR